MPVPLPYQPAPPAPTRPLVEAVVHFAGFAAFLHGGHLWVYRLAPRPILKPGEQDPARLASASLFATSLRPCLLVGRIDQLPPTVAGSRQVAHLVELARDEVAARRALTVSA